MASVRRLLLVSAALALTQLAPAHAQDPLKVGSVYSPVLENERVRVMVATFPPGGDIAMHSHPDHVVYVLAAGTLDIVGANGKVDAYALKEGQAVWLPAQSHSAKNTGSSAVRVLVIELKK